MRHGTTCYQTVRRNRVYPRDGRDFPGLTESGKKLVFETAQKVKELSIEIIYSSDFRRARETSEIVARVASVDKIIFSPKLRDIDLGIYHDRPKEDFYKDFSEFPWLSKPKGGESLSEVKERMVKFLNDIDKKHKDNNILIVSHGEPLLLLEAEVKGIEARDKSDYIQPGELRKLKR